MIRRRRFSGIHDTSKEVTLTDVMKWKLSTLFSFSEDVPYSLPVVRRDLSQKGDFICWLSHASFLVSLGGKRILIDPVFGNIPFYKRYTPFPYAVEELLPVDYLLVSHTHYDHFDVPSLKALAKKSNFTAVLPLCMGALLSKKVAQRAVYELDWYEIYEAEGLKITLVPAKHWGRRGAFDTNTVLWGGYILEYAGKTIYFAGDTAYGSHFKEIGERFRIDVALLPIGAYEPSHIMKHNHLDPDEAYLAFADLGAKEMIPMHYGTFKLTDEPMAEPLQRIGKISSMKKGKICCLDVGEIHLL